MRTRLTKKTVNLLPVTTYQARGATAGTVATHVHNVALHINLGSHNFQKRAA